MAAFGSPDSSLTAVNSANAGPPAITGRSGLCPPRGDVRGRARGGAGRPAAPGKISIPSTTAARCARASRPRHGGCQLPQVAVGDPASDPSQHGHRHSGCRPQARTRPKLRNPQIQERARSRGGSSCRLLVPRELRNIPEAGCRRSQDRGSHSDASSAHRSSDENKRTVYTITARATTASGSFVFYQNSPPQHPLTSTAPNDTEPPSQHDRARFPLMRSRATPDSSCPNRAERRIWCACSDASVALARAYVRCPTKGARHLPWSGFPLAAAMGVSVRGAS